MSSTTAQPNPSELFFPNPKLLAGIKVQSPFLCRAHSTECDLSSPTSPHYEVQDPLTQKIQISKTTRVNLST